MPSTRSGCVRFHSSPHAPDSSPAIMSCVPIAPSPSSGRCFIASNKVGLLIFLPPLPVLRERDGVRGEGAAELERRALPAVRNHPHPNLLPAYREKGPEPAVGARRP